MPNDIDQNPLEPSADHEQRVRERAYHLWEADGRPEGKDADYWERARELEAIGDSAGAGLLPINTIERADEAAIEDNLGEFPDRFSDQGDRRPSPMTRGELRGDQGGSS